MDPVVEELRLEIDRLDAELVALLRRRLELSLKVGARKVSLGLPVYDPDRERRLVERVEEGVVREAYASVVARCRRAAGG